MTVRTWLHAAVLVVCGVVSAAVVSQAVAQAKDKIPVNPKLLVEPPDGAIVLFSGKPEQLRDNWYERYGKKAPGWNVNDKGVATPNRHDVTSKQEFGDCYLHVEFCEPMTSSGNSGVGMQGRYEIQILNSYGKKPEAHECGAIYSQTPPKVIASKPAGEWQTFDIFFRARASTPAASSQRRPASPPTRTARRSTRMPRSKDRPASITESSKAKWPRDPSSCKATTTRYSSATSGSCRKATKPVAESPESSSSLPACHAAGGEESLLAVSLRLLQRFQDDRPQVHHSAALLLQGLQRDGQGTCFKM